MITIIPAGLLTSCQQPSGMVILAIKSFQDLVIPTVAILAVVGLLMMVGRAKRLRFY